MVTLRFLAKRDFQSEVGDVHGVSMASADLSAVWASLCQRLDNIHFPTSNVELRRMKEDFHDLAGFPNAVGAVDGTLISIQGMSGDDEKLYVCRKGYRSLNIQAVVDSKMRFLNINCKFPGATHDTYILANSRLPDIVSSLREDGWLLGDSGYPRLLTPLNQPSTPQEA